MSDANESLKVALALSKSLHEVEQIKEYDAKKTLAETCGGSLVTDDDHDRRKLLQSFALDCDKSVAKKKVQSKKST